MVDTRQLQTPEPSIGVLNEMPAAGDDSGAVGLEVSLNITCLECKSDKNQMLPSAGSVQSLEGQLVGDWRPGLHPLE